MGPFTVDASVFLNAFNPREAGHADSFRFLARLHEHAIPMVAPTLLLPEVAGVIGSSPRAARPKKPSLLACGLGLDGRELAHRRLDRRLRICEVLQFAGQVRLVGAQVEVPVAREPE